MLLAIDIGNSMTKFAIFDGSKLVTKFSIQTKRDYTVEELLFDRLRLFEKHLIQVDIDTCSVSSVVPDLNAVIAQVCRELFKVTPQIIDAHWDFGFEIAYSPPSAVGADRLVNCFAAVSKHGFPAVVCSFGTATTIDVVDDKHRYIGGIIAPGMATSAKALHMEAARLPLVSIELPPAVVGNSTENSIRSGIVNGHLFMVDGMLKSIAADAVVTATGGFGEFISSQLSSIHHFEENLTLEGIRLLTERRSAPQFSHLIN